MGRRERPIDPTLGLLEAFAFDLRLLCAKAGDPSYRRLAQRAGVSASALSAAAGGAVLPSRRVTLAYVSACGADINEWSSHWETLRAQLTAPGAADAAARNDRRSGGLRGIRAPTGDRLPAAPHRAWNWLAWMAQFPVFDPAKLRGAMLSWRSARLRSSLDNCAGTSSAMPYEVPAENLIPSSPSFPLKGAPFKCEPIPP